MAVSPKRILKITGVVVLILGAIGLAGGYLLRDQLEKKLKEKLLAAGFHTKSITLSFLNRSIALDSVQFVPPDTSSHVPHQLVIQKIRVTGIGIIRFLKKKEIMVDHLSVSDGQIRYNKNFQLPKDSSRTKSPPDINVIRIRKLEVTNIAAVMLNDTTPESFATLSHLILNEFNLAFGQDTAYSIDWFEVKLKNLQQSKKEGLHAFAVSQMEYSSQDQRLVADSFRVIPRYNKNDFARTARIQKTRLDVLLPKIIIEGLDKNRFLTDSTLTATRIRIPNAVVHAYRDKRYPFVRDWIMPLPIEGIRRLPFKLAIDSILISEADIAYEEFSEKGLPATGTITFNKLNASLANLNTELARPDRKEFSTLITTCKVMNNGLLQATFKLPLNPAVNYEAYGNVRNMDLTSLNPALGNLTRMEISAGTLNDLRFNFSYNDNVSKGQVLINYTDLKLTALKKETGYRETNKLLTTVINTVIKSNKDKTVDKSKRTGVIDIEREKKRFVFQFWWKSLLDGLQSTFTDNGKKKKTPKESSR